MALRTIKNAAIQWSKRSGLHTLIANSRWRQQRLAILCYHAVSIDDEHEWDPRFYISPERLEKRCQMLRDGDYNVLPLGDAVAKLYSGTLPPRSVALTFDDGTFDFHCRAWPILKRYSIPATVYLTTFYCHHPRPVFGMFCYYLMWKGRNSYRGQPLLDLRLTPDLSTESGRMQAAGAVVAWAEERNLPLAEKDLLAMELARQLGVSYEAILTRRILQLMKPAEVSELFSQGLDIQLHTHRHRTPRDQGLFVREIAENRKFIGEMIGAQPTEHFCYPSGVYFPEFFPWLKKLNVRSATTCVSGLAAPSDNPYLLPRIIDTNTLTDSDWEAWLLGVRERLGWRSNQPPANRP